MSLFDQLKEMQWKQLQHDEKYHKEIWLLDVQRRTTHMVLHFAKYSAKINSAVYLEDREGLIKCLVDMLVIATSTANIFNAKIYDVALSDSEKRCADVMALASEILESLEINGSGVELEISMKINGVIADMCKTAEALDHLESLSFRSSIIDCSARLFRYSLAFLCLVGVEDVLASISDRLVMVEKKNFFFDKLGNYISGYK